MLASADCMSPAAHTPPAQSPQLSASDCTLLSAAAATAQAPPPLPSAQDCPPGGVRHTLPYSTQRKHARIRSFVNPGLRRVGCEKDGRTLKYLGAASFDAVVCHIQAKMDIYNTQNPGSTQMSFHNVELDHIKPVQQFGLEMCHYTNIQPMLKEANRSKGGKWSEVDETFWKTHILYQHAFTDIYAPPTGRPPAMSCAVSRIQPTPPRSPSPTQTPHSDTQEEQPSPMTLALGRRFAAIVQRGDKSDVVWYKEIRHAAADAGMGILCDAQIDECVWTLYALRSNQPSKLVGGRMKQDRGFKSLRLHAPPARVPPPDIVPAPAPRQWQAELFARMLQRGSARVVHVVINNAKGAPDDTSNSALMRWVRAHKTAQKIPALMDSAEKIMGWCMSLPLSSCYVVDMPRVPAKRAIRRVYTAIEELSKGYMCCVSGRGKEVYFDEPDVVVFTNSPPKLKYLSEGRWKLWTVTGARELVPFESLA